MLQLETVAAMWQGIAQRIYPKSTEHGTIKHLCRESNELLEEIETYDAQRQIIRESDDERLQELLEKKKYEYADCFICLFTGLAKAGISLEGITKIIADKALINGMDREWNYNGDGSYSHIK